MGIFQLRAAPQLEYSSDAKATLKILSPDQLDAFRKIEAVVINHTYAQLRHLADEKRAGPALVVGLINFYPNHLTLTDNFIAVYVCPKLYVTVKFQRDGATTILNVQPHDPNGGGGEPRGNGPSGGGRRFSCGGNSIRTELALSARKSHCAPTRWIARRATDRRLFWSLRETRLLDSSWIDGFSNTITSGSYRLFRKIKNFANKFKLQHKDSSFVSRVALYSCNNIESRNDGIVRRLFSNKHEAIYRDINSLRQSNDVRQAYLFYIDRGNLSDISDSIFAYTVIFADDSLDVVLGGKRSGADSDTANLILAACLDFTHRLRGDLDLVHLRCDGIAPFTDRYDRCDMSLVSDWRNYFRVKVAGEPKSAMLAHSPGEINLHLDHHTIELISEYFKTAEERFYDGESYHDSFNWHELGYFLHRENEQARITVSFNVITSHID